jgi:hypothetical protein
LWFLDDDDRMKTTIGLTEFTLNAMTLGAGLTKRYMSRVKNLKKQASSREDRFSKILFALSRCRITEDNGSGDLLSRSQMYVDERDEVAFVAQER